MRKRTARLLAAAPAAQEKPEVAAVDGAVSVDVGGAARAGAPRAQQEAEVAAVDGAALIDVRRAFACAKDGDGHVVVERLVVLALAIDEEPDRAVGRDVVRDVRADATDKRLVSVAREAVEVAVLTDESVRIAPVSERVVPDVELDLRAGVREALPFDLDLVDVGGRLGQREAERVRRLIARGERCGDVAVCIGDAAGGITDANRYITAALSSGNEATHAFRFTLTEAPADIDEIKVEWEGFADACTQVELYVWNNALGNWGDANGLVGQNRYLDSFAGNRDETLVGRISSNISNYVAADGTIRFLVYGERQNDETFHDYMAVTVLRASECPADIDQSGAVDSSDLGLLLSAWGACAGCAADIDGNGAVDSSDLGLLLSGWGGCQ